MWPIEDLDALNALAVGLVVRSRSRVAKVIALAGVDCSVCPSGTKSTVNRQGWNP